MVIEDLVPFTVKDLYSDRSLGTHQFDDFKTIHVLYGAPNSPDGFFLLGDLDIGEVMVYKLDQEAQVRALYGERLELWAFGLTLGERSKVMEMPDFTFRKLEELGLGSLCDPIKMLDFQIGSIWRRIRKL